MDAQLENLMRQLGEAINDSISSSAQVAEVIARVKSGGYDVFVVPSHGGRPRRLTFDSAQDMATGWTPDGKGITFSVHFK